MIQGSLNKIEPSSNKLKHPKSSKNSISVFKEAPAINEDFIPLGLVTLQNSGAEDYYSRFGISRILKLPLTKCQDYFQTNNVQIFKCKKVKAVRGKKKISEDEEMVSMLFPEPYDIFLVVTDKAVFTTLDIKKDASNKWMYIDSRYTMYDLVKITSLKNSNSVITFYFRTPNFSEYNLHLEDMFLENLNEKPSADYIFAHKRKSYIEICVVVMFENSEVAHKCIKKVSHLYKILKHNEASKEMKEEVKDSLIP